MYDVVTPIYPGSGETGELILLPCSVMGVTINFPPSLTVLFLHGSYGFG